MSTDYSLEKKIRISDLFDGRLERFGVREHILEKKSNKRCLTDGRSVLWVSADDEGFVSYLSRYAGNLADTILGAIAEAFSTDIFSEYEPQYWGYDTQEEWEAAWVSNGKRA
jgi:hypothetical protein